MKGIFHSHRPTRSLPLSYGTLAAVMLHERLGEAEAKRDAILAEVSAEGSPEEQREKLLAQVRKHNEEVAALDRSVAEARDKRESALEEMRELEEELQDAQGWLALLTRS